jgi:putative transposase
MPQSLVKNYIQIVFSTKHRQPLISPPFENEIHSYLAGTCKRLSVILLSLADTPIMFTSCVCSQKNIIGRIDDRIIATFTEVDQNKR